MACPVCLSSNYIKTWVYGDTCDEHDAAIRAGHRAWVDAGGESYRYRVSKEFDDLVMTLQALEAMAERD